MGTDGTRRRLGLTANPHLPRHRNKDPVSTPRGTGRSLRDDSQGYQGHGTESPEGLPGARDGVSGATPGDTGRDRTESLEGCVPSSPGDTTLGGAVPSLTGSSRESETHNSQDRQERRLTRTGASGVLREIDTFRH